LTTSGIIKEDLILLQRGKVLASFADIERHGGCEDDGSKKVRLQGKQ
jgi:hypothetical protein